MDYSRILDVKLSLVQDAQVDVKGDVWVTRSQSCHQIVLTISLNV
jgi:hypothetical protein